jgi:OHCU decarboxylase
VRLEALNALAAPDAERELRRCCASTRWASAMAAARPFPSHAAMTAAADAIEATLGPPDWMEAFAGHPRIGAGGGGTTGGAATGTETWSAQEQASVADAGEIVSRRLADANRAYEARFGYTFIVCATGRNPREMLDMLDQRLGNNPERELQVAADEQRKITRLRMVKLLQ